MSETLTFIIEIIGPTILALAILSRIANVRHVEEMQYALIGILATKGYLNIEDLGTLKMFQPQENMFVAMLDIIKR
ncbi:MAG: hypothetical protein ACXABY_07975 [Candidatus Thorarchaeota archaeon]|jgi:hypothetical protein